VANQIDFVGSVSGIQGRCGAPTGFDSNHEGHSGWEAYNIAQNNIANWMTQSKPEVVQVLLGTNDINIGKRPAASIIGAYTSLVQKMRAANPNVVIVVRFMNLILPVSWPLKAGAKIMTNGVFPSQFDEIIPMRWDDATAAQVNNQIPAWVQQHNSTESPIYLVDTTRGFEKSMLQGDGVHPNTQGDQVIADRVAPLIIEAVNLVLARRSS